MATMKPSLLQTENERDDESNAGDDDCLPEQMHSGGGGHPEQVSSSSSSNITSNVVMDDSADQDAAADNDGNGNFEQDENVVPEEIVSSAAPDEIGSNIRPYYVTRQQRRRRQEEDEETVPPTRTTSSNPAVVVTPERGSHSDNDSRHNSDSHHGDSDDDIRPTMVTSSSGKSAVSTARAEEDHDEETFYDCNSGAVDNTSDDQHPQEPDPKRRRVSDVAITSEKVDEEREEASDNASTEADYSLAQEQQDDADDEREMQPAPPVAVQHTTANEAPVTAATRLHVDKDDPIDERQQVTTEEVPVADDLLAAQDDTLTEGQQQQVNNEDTPTRVNAQPVERDSSCSPEAQPREQQAREAAERLAAANAATATALEQQQHSTYSGQQQGGNERLGHGLTPAATTNTTTVTSVAGATTGNSPLEDDAFLFEQQMIGPGVGAWLGPGVIPGFQSWLGSAGMEPDLRQWMGPSVAPWTVPGTSHGVEIPSHTTAPSQEGVEAVATTTKVEARQHQHQQQQAHPGLAVANPMEGQQDQQADHEEETKLPPVVVPRAGVTLKATQLQHSVGRTRKALNKHLSELGLTAKFSMGVISSAKKKVSHLSFNHRWNDLPRDQHERLQWWLGEGIGRLRLASPLDPAKQQQNPIPIFWAVDQRVSGGSLCHYVGHFRSVKFQANDQSKVVFRRKKRQALVELEFVKFDCALAVKLARIDPTQPDSTLSATTTTTTRDIPAAVPHAPIVQSGVMSTTTTTRMTATTVLRAPRVQPGIPSAINALQPDIMPINTTTSMAPTSATVLHAPLLQAGVIPIINNASRENPETALYEPHVI